MNPYVERLQKVIAFIAAFLALNGQFTEMKIINFMKKNMKNMR